MAAEIRHHIVKIGQKVNDSQLRGLVDRYLRLASRTHAANDGLGFPRTVHCHRKSPEKCQKAGFGDLLCFHIGNTLLAFYAAVRGEEGGPLLARVSHLRDMAAIGPRSFVSYGDDSEGYWLVTHDVARSLMSQKKAKLDAEQDAKDKARGF